MEIKLCRICGKQDDNYVHIFKTEGLKNKIETCLPIVVMQHYSLPDTICTVCLDTVDNFYSFIKSCLQNIIVLEAQYEIIESCLKTKRKVDRSVSVEPCDLPVSILPIPLLKSEEDELKLPFLVEELKSVPCALVDYECSSSDSDDEQSNETGKKSTKSDIIDEIVQRKCLKRKNESSGASPTQLLVKQPRHEESSSRRKNSRPKRVEYHVETLATAPSPTLQTCLLCEAQLAGLMPLAAHMYEVHGIDLSQVYGGGAPPELPDPAPPKRKIPELVKISDVLTLGKLPGKLTVEVVGAAQYATPHYDDSVEINPIITTTTTTTTTSVPSRSSSLPTPMAALNDSLFLCSECPGGRRPFSSFAEFSAHRRAQHQIFHCDLCPKFYGRNSHLWKHVNRVHKGHSAVTCADCGKTSASEYHLHQHRNKMHAASAAKAIATDKRVKASDSDVAVAQVDEDEHKEDEEEEEEDEAEEVEEEDNARLSDDDLLNKKFQGFDFKSVRQSFLRQELMNKRQRYVSVLKKNNIFDDDDKPEASKTELRDPTPPPKEIDSSSDLYTTIITNYTPPSNEGPYKCPKCLKGFHKKNLVKKHKKNCRPRLQKDLLTRCKTCSRIFKDRQSLAKHLVNYHSEYTCEICHVAVQSKCEIVSHIRFTHPGSELHCHCGQILRSKADLGRHKAEHRDSHVCQFCADQLPTKIKLKMHILSLHRKILALSCGICLKLFETQHVLRAHVRHAHGAQLRPLTSCTVCGKNYGSKWKTYDHLNKSHGRIFKACKACLEVFETERDLHQHFEREHVNNGAGGGSHQSVAAPAAIVKLKERKSTGTVKKMSEPEEQYDEDGTTDDYVEFVEQQKKAKISLLEKRLLGKKALEPTEWECNNEVQPQPQPPLPLIPPNSNDDILQNSSKRTVYVNSNDPSLCEICLKVWPAKKHLWQHYIRCHKSTAATVCGICLKTNPSYSALQRHLRDTHPRLLHGQGFGSNFICKICGRYHNASSKLRLHMAIHVGYTTDDEANEEEPQTSNANPHPAADDEHGQQEEEEEEEEEDEEEEEAEEAEEEDDTKQMVQVKIENDDEDSVEAEPQMKPDVQTTQSNGSHEEDSDEDEDEDEEEEEEDEDDDEESEQEVETEIGSSQAMKTEPDEDDVYYESLIEEVEASDEDGDENNENVENSEGDSRSESPRDMEREMLRNMMCESRTQRLHVKSEAVEDEDDDDDDADADADSDDDEDQADEEILELQNGEMDENFVEEFNVDVKEEIVKSELQDSDESTAGDELDSAIRSICAGSDLDAKEEDDVLQLAPERERYKRIHRVNESELETAVGSIL